MNTLEQIKEKCSISGYEYMDFIDGNIHCRQLLSKEKDQRIESVLEVNGIEEGRLSFLKSIDEYTNGKVNITESRGVFFGRYNLEDNLIKVRVPTSKWEQ